MIAFRIVSGVTLHFMWRLPEWFNAVTLFLYGQTLLAPGDTFDSSPSFAVMAHYASEDTWGWCIIGIASIRLLALILNGTFDWFAPWSVRIRAISTTLCCFGWFCISLGLYLSGVPAPGWKTYAMHLALDIILAIHLGGQAGRIDRGRWNAAA